MPLSNAPWFSIPPLLKELLSRTNEDSAYVNLSDGGHFEDLGLYEMVRRRCKLIIVSDGDHDPDHGFEDLGNAVRKIWIDLGRMNLIKFLKFIIMSFCDLVSIFHIRDFTSFPEKSEANIRVERKKFS